MLISDSDQETGIKATRGREERGRGERAAGEGRRHGGREGGGRGCQGTCSILKPGDLSTPSVRCKHLTVNKDINHQPDRLALKTYARHEDVASSADGLAIYIYIYIIYMHEPLLQLGRACCES